VRASPRSLDDAHTVEREHALTHVVEQLPDARVASLSSSVLFCNVVSAYSLRLLHTLAAMKPKPTVNAATTKRLLCSFSNDSCGAGR
jgi:hypothetical protein